MCEAAVSEAPARRSRGTRRDNAAKPLGVPYIVRGIPTYDVLSEEEKRMILGENAVKLLRLAPTV